MASSDLISSISSPLGHLDLMGRGVPWSTSLPIAALQLRIELRNVQMLLEIRSRKSGDDLPSRFSAIEAATARILLQEIPSRYGPDIDAFEKWIYLDALPEVRGLAKQLAAECYTSPLHVDDVAALADSILENDASWRSDPHFRRVNVTDALVAQVTFLKCLLAFAKGSGAQLQHLMIHFQPFAINAARVFIRDECAYLLRNWYEEVNLKCSAAIGIATQAPSVYEAYTQALSTSTFSYAQIGVLDNFLDSLVSLLWEFLCHHSNSRVKDQLKVLYESLRFCRRILMRKPESFDGEIRNRIGDLVCGAGMLVCSLHRTHVDLSYPDRLSELLQRFGVLQAQVENDSSKSTAPTINDLGSGDLAHIMISDGNEETATSGHTPQRSSIAPQVAGFQDDEVNLVLDRLMRGSKQLQIVPICGMAGLGKTTFASALYNHRSIVYHFQSRARCTISQVMDKRKVLLQLLNPESENYTDMTEDDIANKLRQSLKGKRYLVFLDDVWTTEAWHSLAASFPDDATQSKIIFTSRYHHVVPDQLPYLLRLRECLEILKMKVSHKCWTSEFGMTVAKMCNGLPLTTTIVAGLLASTTKQGWKGILDHLSLRGISSEKKCNSVLELSFNHLSNDLKLCESKRIEDVALEYMEDLIQRSLVMVAQNRSTGGVKTCRIHDLIHSFCLRKAKQDNFFHILSQRGDELLDFNEPHNLQRLSIHSDPSHFKEARLFCPRAHSMLFFSTNSSIFFDLVFIVHIFKLLRVLDMRGVFCSNGIPSEIELLTQLRYLYIRGDLPVIPSSLGNLLNLETFFGEFQLYGVLSFPPTFWNLHKLKWLSSRCGIYHGFTLPTENLENSCALLELETLCGVVFYSYGSMEQQMRKFPNIRKLKCSILPNAEQQMRKLPDIHRSECRGELLNQLESLSIFGEGLLGFGFGSREHLRRLSLRGMILSRENVSDIGKLPNLEVLKLQGIEFCNDTLDMKEGEFSKLIFLELIRINIKRWTISDEQLPCLKILILYFCAVSEEFPYDCFKTSATLEEILVHTCSRKVENFAREIQEAQQDFGNLVEFSII